VVLWGPVIAWMAVIFFFSSQSDLGPIGRRTPDWVAHPAAYAAGALLLCRALAGGWGRPAGDGALALAVVLIAAYGVTDELHQSFVPGRDADVLDVAKDLGGAAAASLFYRRASGAARIPSEEVPR
jgi:VanZ family protein